MPQTNAEIPEDLTAAPELAEELRRRGIQITITALPESPYFQVEWVTRRTRRINGDSIRSMLRQVLNFEERALEDESELATVQTARIKTQH